MEISEYGQYDGIGLAKLVADKEVSAKELAQTALKIAERLDPDLGAMVDTFEEEVNGLDEASLPDGPFRPRLYGGRNRNQQPLFLRA